MTEIMMSETDRLSANSPAEFRSALRAWLGRQVPTGLEDVFDWRRRALRHTPSDSARIEAMASPEYVEWERRLLAARLVCPQWPVEYGGRGLDAAMLLVMNEEFARRRVPRVLRDMGESLVGPAILKHGTAEQKAYFLPRIVNGSDVYCQGYSEPGSGSDLASLMTRGVVDGDELVIHGQKIWTSHAHHSNMMFILCRTGDAEVRHRSITYALLELGSHNHAEVRPIVEMSGAAGFAECHFDGARVPLFNVINGIDGGWAPAMTTLGFERSGEATTAYLGFMREVELLIDYAAESGALDDHLTRQDLAWAWGEVQAMRAMGLRSAATMLAGRQPGAEGLLNKLFWSEYHARFAQIAVAIAGADVLLRDEDCDERALLWQDIFFLSRGETIFAGTSEIQRNTIAERGLGLPR